MTKTNRSKPAPDPVYLDTLVAHLRTMQDAHAAIIRVRCETAGVVVGSAAADKLLADDLDVAKAYLASLRVEAEYLRAFGEDTTVIDAQIEDEAIGIARILVAREIASGRVRDQGTCVLGAGVAVDVRAKRQRYARRRILVGAPFQGNIGSRAACEPALSFLRENGFPGAYWHDGAMD